MTFRFVGALVALMAMTSLARGDTKPPPITEAAVREHVIERLNEAPEVKSISERSDGGLDIVLQNGTPLVSYLDNTLVRLGNSEPTDRAAVLDAFIETVTAMNTADFDKIKPEALRWSVYDDQYLRDAYAVKNADDDVTMTFDQFMQPRERIAGDIWAVMVKDTPTSVATLSLEQLKKAGIAPEAAREQADAAMLAMAFQAGVSQDENSDLYMVQLDGYYENALMTVPELWTNVSKNIGGEIVAITPARGWLLFAVDPDAAALAKLREVATGAHSDQSHPISSGLFRWTGDGWDVFTGK